MKRKLKKGLGIFIMIYVGILVMGGGCSMSMHSPGDTVGLKEVFVIPLVATIAILGFMWIMLFSIKLMDKSYE